MIETIRVDMHCHSSLSDGDHSPTYVAHSMAAVGVTWAALTDHNSVEGQPQFQSVLERRGVNSVVGVEMDGRSPHGVFHLLGYGFDAHHADLLDALHTIRHPLRASARRLLHRERATTDELAPHTPPDTAQAISLLHEAGGIVFLAHPLAGLDTIERLQSVLEWMQPQGLDGIEAFHKQYSSDTQEALLSVAEHRGLLAIAGSDFHGVHHNDGGSPGVDMPLVHWRRFMIALGLGGLDGPPASSHDRAATQRGHVGD